MRHVCDERAERHGELDAEIANALADNLPLPKLTARKSRRRRRKRKPATQPETAAAPGTDETTEDEAAVETVATAEPVVPTDVEDAA